LAARNVAGSVLPALNININLIHFAVHLHPSSF